MVTRLGVTVAAISLAAQAGVHTHARAEVAVTDDAGRIVRLQGPAQRIVALSPHLTELVFDAGAGGRLVGVAAHSDHPEAARAIERVGDARGLDAEAIVRLRPDLVVAWSSGNARRFVERLRRLGLPVFESEPTRLEHVASTVERLARLAGTEQAAQDRANRYRSRLAALEARHAGDPPLRVFYQIWDRPLITVNGGHVISDALRVCGGRNVFAELGALTPAPSREAVLLAEPEAIVVASGGTDAIATWQRWRQLPAVRSDRVVSVDPSGLHRATLRILDAVTDLCDKLRSPRSG